MEFCEHEITSFMCHFFHYAPSVSLFLRFPPMVLLDSLSVCACLLESVCVHIVFLSSECMAICVCCLSLQVLGLCVCIYTDVSLIVTCVSVGVVVDLVVYMCVSALKNTD